MGYRQALGKNLCNVQYNFLIGEKKSGCKGERVSIMTRTNHKGLIEKMSSVLIVSQLKSKRKKSGLTD